MLSCDLSMAAISSEGDQSPREGLAALIAREVRVNSRQILVAG